MYSFTSVGTATWQILFVTETLRVKLSNIVCSKLSITSIGFSSKVGFGSRVCASVPRRRNAISESLTPAGACNGHWRRK